jgi:hypothetical protein
LDVLDFGFCKEVFLLLIFVVIFLEISDFIVLSNFFRLELVGFFTLGILGFGTLGRLNDKQSD